MLLHNNLNIDFILKTLLRQRSTLLPLKRRDKDRHSLMHATKMPHLLPYKVVLPTCFTSFLFVMGAVITAVFAVAVVLIAFAAFLAAFPLTPLPHTFQQHAAAMTSTRVPTQAACSCSSMHH
ncbi:hypothetical protein AMECASPLE_021764 [Ameca splendens]|uniref:Transmembrane protein n=1 Tax=Ameca splendens TaxID=208324 RepID=A0ABV0ZPT2_9TELE